MRIVNCEIGKIPKLINYYISQLNIGLEGSFRIVMSRETHRTLVKCNDNMLAGTTRELTSIYGAKIFFDDDIPYGEFEVFVCAVDALCGQRKTGEWKFVDGYGVKCSECGADYFQQFKYCPNCGIKMRGRADE